MISAALVVLFTAAAVGATASTSGGGVGCAKDRRGVVFTAAGVVSTPRSALPIPCLVTIPRSTAAKESQLAVTRAGTIVYQAGLTMTDGDSSQPIQVAVSPDGGTSWSPTGSDVSGAGQSSNGIDNHLYRDRDTDRLFWVVFGLTNSLPKPVLGRSDDGGRTWAVGSMPCCNDAENPHLLAAPPRGSTTSGYPNVLYWCTNTSVVGGIVFPVGLRLCFKSLDGGTSWDGGHILLNKQVGQYPDCTGRGEMFDALDGYYPTADGDGRLYMNVRCGPTTEYVDGPPTTNPAFILESDDEMATWHKVSESPPLPPGYASSAGGPSKEELRADRDGNLYLVRGTKDPTYGLYLWVSRDRGLTWTPPQQINLPGTRIVNEPLWQVSVGEPGHLVVDYAGTQGAGPDLNAYLVETTNALADHPVFRGAALNDPNGDWHEPYALGSEDYTDVEIGPDGIARAAFPRGKVGYLAPSRR